MKKQLLLVLAISTYSAHAMNYNKESLISLVPKCVSYCERTITNYKKNMLRASQQHNAQSMFKYQIRNCEQVISQLNKALDSHSHTDLYNAIEQFTKITYSVAFLPAMWPQSLTRREINIIKNIKACKNNEHK